MAKALREPMAAAVGVAVVAAEGTAVRTVAIAPASRASKLQLR